MADLFSVTAPLAIRYRDGSKEVMVKRLPYDDGLLYLPTFWTEKKFEDALRFVAGPIRGEGPWKVGEAVVTVLGCHGTDAELASDFSCWQGSIIRADDTFPTNEEIEQRMKTCAARAAASGKCHPRFIRQD